MSKRSYRRLAVVAGAALAVGSMAPAMAAQVVSTNAGAAAVDVDTINVAPLLGSVQHNLIPSTAALGTVTSVQLLATSTALGAVNDAQGVVGGAVLGAQCLVGAGTSAVLGVTGVATAGATATVGLGTGLSLGLGGGANALLGAPLALVGTATGCLSPIQGAAMATVGNVQSKATAVADLATTTALSGVGLVRLPGTVMTTASPLLLNDLLSVGVSGGASSSTVAGLAGLVDFL